ncbi:aldose epimerase family protein [Sediminibacillus massiliensis]|uniref:aldose epimerase family protein n=1 Tax=Sediminibacillus massiliensis TaxID=1926277 RepID=UPI000988892D|nr:aldose epimerase family protein [Sediminibacillus massiliensis]
MEITRKEFGELNGEVVHEYILRNENGFEIACLDYGCIISRIMAGDTDGNRENVVLGFDNLDDYLKYSPFFGAIIGRVAGRIKEGKFELNGVSYQLPQNEGRNHLHGGKGFDTVIWSAEEIDRSGNGEIGLSFSYRSPNGDQGYPGNLDVTVEYLLNNENELTISYSASSDQDTIVNLTNHTYFNLTGNLKDDILNHQLQMKSDRFLELDRESLPTGEMLDVEGTPFDFREGRKIEDGTTSSHPQNIQVGNGYDHPFLLKENHNREIVLTDPESARELAIETDAPSVVVYSGNQLTGEFQIGGITAKKHLGICLETQGLPDAVHHDDFPSIVLKQGEQYQTKTRYKFSVNK